MCFVLLPLFSSLCLSDFCFVRALSEVDPFVPLSPPPPTSIEPDFTEPPPVKQVHNPFAIQRPHATPTMLERQGSFRGFNSLSNASPFKRQLSLRLSDLPSNLERQRSHSLEPSDSRAPPVRPSGQFLANPMATWFLNTNKTTGSISRQIIVFGFI